MNQRPGEQAHLLLMSGCSLTARESSSPQVPALIVQMPGPRTFIGAKEMRRTEVPNSRGQPVYAVGEVVPCGGNRRHPVHRRVLGAVPPRTPEPEEECDP